MMTGIVSVSSLYLIYRILTLVFLLLFGIYDFRHHLIKNTALVFLSLWCLFGILQLQPMVVSVAAISSL